jgi:outer membrane protein OmpA-like peptidoglycan-associated protein
MKGKILVALLAIALPFFADAQFNGIMNKVKNKAKQRADNRVDREIDKALDDVEGKGAKKEEPAQKTPAVSKAETKEAPATPMATPEEPALTSFTKYDFIPGERVLYYDNFEGEALAELPTNWNTSGTGEVTTIDKYPGNWLRLHKPFTYLSSNTHSFGENFTVEFDLILNLKNNGWAYPEIYFGLMATRDEAPAGNNFLRDQQKYASIVTTILPAEFKNSKARVNSYLGGRSYFTGDNKMVETLENYYGRPLHFAMQVQKERVRIWINEEKMFDVPKGAPLGEVMNQLYFEVGHTNYKEEQYGVFVSNIKVATGKPDARHKLVEEGKFSTTGILFDFQSAVIKPESYAVIKDIATVLKDNSGIRIKVIGHTSSDGDDNANMELSKKRAAAVKEMLTTEFGIDAGRLESEGKGETQPAADNKTKEGKMLNRRVEFIKL